MKRLIIAAVLAGLVATLSLTMSPDTSAAPPAPFSGAWEAVDVIDQSHMMLWIGGQATYRLVLFDDWASVCDPGGPAIAFGRGWAFGNLLFSRLWLWCLAPTPTFWGSGPYTLTYDPFTDTLLSSDGNTWHRLDH